MSQNLYKVFAGDTHQARGSEEFARADYLLTGWNTSPDGTGTQIACLSTILPNSDMKMYAQWQKAAYEYTFYVYPHDGDYSSTVTTDGQSYYTSQQENVFRLTAGKSATLTISNAPGLEIIPLDGTFGGQSKIVVNDGSTGARTFTFTVGEFTKVNIIKIGSEHVFSYNGKAKTKITEYEQFGSIAGGMTYNYQWYDDMTFVKNGKTSTSAAYSFQVSSTSFVNLAHKGCVTSHSVSAWLVCQDMDTSAIVSEVGPFVQTGLSASTGETLKNFGTHYFPNIQIDLTQYPTTRRFQIGTSVQDYGWKAGCTGVKFRGKYKVSIVT